MKHILIFIIIIFSTLTFADNGKVTITNVSTLTSVAGQTSATAFSLISEQAGDASTEAVATKIYIPMSNTLGTENTENYFNLNISSIVDHLFGYSTNAAVGNTNSTYKIFIPLTLANTTGSTLYLYAAVKAATGYNIFVNLNTAVGANSTVNGTFGVSPQDICAGATSSATVNCTNFDQNGTPSAGLKEMYIYFFMSTTSNLSIPYPGIDPTSATYNGGVYIDAKLNNTIYPSTGGFSIAITNTRKGDSRLLGTETPSSVIDTASYLQTVAFYGATSGPIVCSSIGTCPANSYSTMYVLGNNQTMDFGLGGLTNDVTYTYAVALQDKYGFVTALSNSTTDTPLKIQELLKRQSCFLLTAGFGEEHYVIDYFRHFRDNTLSKYWLGHKFINFYYEHAPSFALSIYNNQSIRFVIRCLAYSLYFIFNSFWWILTGFFIILLITFSKKLISRKEINND